MKRFLLLFMLFSVVWASCEGTYQLNVPAFLSAGRGALVPLEITLEEGDGLLLNLSIDIGGSTVKSIRTAYHLAKGYSRNPCLLTVSFPKKVDRVDGPSGGAYLTTAFTYLLEDPERLEELSQVVITGAVDEEGRVLPVGGLYEKAKAAKEEGKKAFIAPIPTRLEAYLLDKVGLPYYHVSTLEDVFDVLKGLKEPGAPHLFEEVLEVKNKTTHEVEELRPLYESIRERYRHLLQSVKVDEKYRSFYQLSLERADEVAERGYYYTAANDLFVKLSELSAMDGYEKNIPTKKLFEEVKACLDRYERPPYTREGYEWTAGSLIRYYRAKATYDMLKEEDETSTYGSLEIKSRLTDAYEWCLLAHEMAEYVKGTPISEEDFKEMADDILEKAKGEELDGMIYYALKEYERGEYLTTVYLLGPILLEDVHTFSNASLWYRIYHSQSEYLEDESLESYARVYGHIALKVEEVLSSKEMSEVKDSTCSVWTGPAIKRLLSAAFLFFLAFYVGWYHVSR